MNELLDFVRGIVKFLACLIFIPLIAIAIFDFSFGMALFLAFIFWCIFTSPLAFVGGVGAGKYIGKQ